MGWCRTVRSLSAPESEPSLCQAADLGLLSGHAMAGHPSCVVTPLGRHRPPQPDRPQWLAGTSHEERWQGYLISGSTVLRNLLGATTPEGLRQQLQVPAIEKDDDGNGSSRNAAISKAIPSRVLDRSAWCSSGVVLRLRDLGQRSASGGHVAGLAPACRTAQVDW